MLITPSEGALVHFWSSDRRDRRGRFRVFLAASVVFVSSVTVACGGSSGSKDKAANATTTTTAALSLPPPRDKPPAPGTADSSTSTSTSTSSTPASSTTAAPVGDHGPQQFQSPSGNIGCFIDASGARCDIGQRSWAPPPKPASCDLDYGNGIEVSSDHADFVCAGDTTLGSGPPLPFGSSAQRGVFICESASTGMTCHETRHGHGFFLARESFRLF